MKGKLPNEMMEMKMGEKPPTMAKGKKKTVKAKAKGKGKNPFAKGY